MRAQELQMIEWKERLNSAMNATGTKKAELADVLETRRSTITNYTSGPSATIDAAALFKICRHMGINPAWVIDGKGAMKVDPEALTVAADLFDEPRFATRSDNIITMKLKGERSFEPRIHEGDILFIDQSETALESPHLYCLQDNESGQVFIRRYFSDFLRRKAGFLDGLADESNPQSMALFDKQEFEEMRGLFTIIGRVVGVFTDRI